MKEQTISINTIIDRLMRHPLMKDITRDTIIDYSVDFMRIVGVPQMFIEKVMPLTIVNHKGVLPCDVITVRSIRDTKTKEALLYSDSVYHFSPNNDKENVYKIQNNVVFTSLKNTELEVSYTAIMLDEEGIPKIPDNSSFLRALELYIKKQWFTVLFDTQIIPPAVLNNVQQEYAWAVGDCESEFKRMNLDEASSFYKMWKNLLVTKPKI